MKSKLLHLLQSHRSLRSVAAVVLIGCLVFPFVGTYTYLEYAKHKVGKEVKRSIIAGIDRDELVLIKIATSESEELLDWEHDHEFEFKGMMYDVVDSETYNDTIWYWCWMDYEETELNKKLQYLKEMAFNQDPARKRDKKNLANYFKVYYVFNSYELSYSTDGRINVIWTHRKEKYTSPYLNLPSPPPRHS